MARSSRSDARAGAFDGLSWSARFDRLRAGEGMRTVVQPILDVKHQRIAGYEALTRFSIGDERRPDVWFAAAREAGIAAEIEVLALRRALELRHRLPPNRFLTVNVSPDLLADPAVRELWVEIGDIRGIVVELTENVPIEDYNDIGEHLDALRTAGALIAVDDAGAGYAGLRHLLDVRPSIVKLDRSLVRGIDRDLAKLELVMLLGTLADRIDAWLLAEGVERDEELETIGALGVPLAQGWALARAEDPWPDIDPEPVAKLRRRLVEMTPGPSGLSVGALTSDVVAARRMEDAQLAFVNRPDLSWVVLLDEFGKPESLLDSDAAMLGMPTRIEMRVNAKTPAVDALRRAMTRPEKARFDPLLVTDEFGELVGLARVEVLITAAVN